MRPGFLLLKMAVLVKVHKNIQATSENILLKCQFDFAILKKESSSFDPSLKPFG